MMHSRRAGIAGTARMIAILIILIAPAWAQDDSEADDQIGMRAARGLAIKDRELDKIEAILRKDEDELAEARAEIQVIQAKIARALLAEEPDMAGIEAMVQDSLGWELKARMIQVERQVAIRKLVGGERWAAMLRLMRISAARLKLAGERLKGTEAERYERLRGFMERLR